MNLNERIIKAIDIRVKKELEKLKYNYYIEGIIKSINGNGIYDVLINGIISKIKSKDGKVFKINDVVLIMIPNGNYSFKFIDCKRPY